MEGEVNLAEGRNGWANEHVCIPQYSLPVGGRDTIAVWSKYSAAWHGAKLSLQNINLIFFEFSHRQWAPRFRLWWRTGQLHPRVWDPSSERIFLLFARVWSAIPLKCFKTFFVLVFSWWLSALARFGRKLRDRIIQFVVKTRLYLLYSNALFSWRLGWDERKKTYQDFTVYSGISFSHLRGPGKSVLFTRSFFCRVYVAQGTLEMLNGVQDALFAHTPAS